MKHDNGMKGDTTTSHTTPDIRAILDRMPYFIEWGQHGWAKLFRRALEDSIGVDMSGKRVLEIGARYGKVSSLFALLGAEVWASDIGESYLPDALAECRKWGVEERVHLLYGAASSLDSVDDGSIDLVFTKSVLVLVPDLPAMLGLISRKLKPGGSVVFIENAYGNVFYHMLRAYKHRSRKGFKRTHYFSRAELQMIASAFPMKMQKRTWFPPVCLYTGIKPLHAEKS